MDYAGINYLAVIVAAIAGFATGSVWYGMLGRHWMKAVGLTEADIRRGQKGAPIPFLIAALADLVMAFMLAGVVGHLGTGNVNVGNGALSGLFLWIGFVLTTIAVNNAFAMRPLKLTLIDTGHWLLVLLVMGAIIGSFRG